LLGHGIKGNDQYDVLIILSQKQGIFHSLHTMNGNSTTGNSRFRFRDKEGKPVQKAGFVLTNNQGLDWLVLGRQILFAPLDEFENMQEIGRLQIHRPGLGLFEDAHVSGANIHRAREERNLQAGKNQNNPFETARFVFPHHLRSPW
jgi:hypothetical protein